MERKGKAEGGRVRRMERSDLDVWLRQPTRARDRDMRAKENDRRGGGVKCLGDQIAERATVAEREGERRKLLADEVGWGDERKGGKERRAVVASSAAAMHQLPQPRPVRRTGTTAVTHSL